MIKQTSLAVIVLATLTACSAGSDSKASSAKVSSANQPTNQPTKPINLGVQSSANSSAKYSGSYYLTEGLKTSFLNEAADYTQLTVDGKNLLSLLGKEHKQMQLVDSRFGVYFVKGKEADIALSIGKITPDAQMPKAGKASYKGNAFYGTEALKGWVEGTSALEVDFDKKIVDGTISVPKHNINVKLPTAPIYQNSFAVAKGNDILHGNFYGKNAAEIGGTFQVGKGIGVFGATKQK